MVEHEAGYYQGRECDGSPSVFREVANNKYLGNECVRSC